jgi:WD40 repeat protein
MDDQDHCIVVGGDDDDDDDGGSSSAGSNDSTSYSSMMDLSKPTVNDKIRCVSYCPDGSILATGSDSHKICLWVAKTSAPIVSLTGHTNSVLCIAFAPSVRDKVLVSGSEDGTIKIWRIADDVTKSHLEKTYADISMHEVCAIAYSPDGKRLASGSNDRISLRMWDTYDATGKVRYLPGITSAPSDHVAAVAFSLPNHRIPRLNPATDPDSLLACGISNGCVKVINPLTGAVIHQLNLTNYVTSLVFSPDARFLVAGCGDGNAHVWTLFPTLQPHSSLLPATTKTLAAHVRPVLGVAYAPNGKLIATASADNTIRVWDADDDCRLISTLTSKGSRVLCVAFSPDSASLAAGSDKWHIQQWRDIQKKK